MSAPREQTFLVKLHQAQIGVIRRKGNVTRFSFDESYWSTPNRSVLGLRFEEEPNEKHRSHLRLPAWFSNLLPEGILRKWISDHMKVSTEREMDLLAAIGHDLPGAVHIVEADAERSPDSETVLSFSSASLSRASSDSLWRFSLAGVFLKFSMLAQGDRFVAPGVGEGGDWIIKMPSAYHAYVPQNEFAMMTLAKCVGIDVPDIKLVRRDSISGPPDPAWSKGEEVAYAIRRFDRGMGRERFHMEDLAQVRGFYPADKYTGAFETVAALLYRRRDVRSLREFTRRLIFNAIISNGDAHLKNWALLYPDKQTPVISPAYDLVSTAVYRAKEAGPEDLGLKFGGSKSFDKVRLSHFAALDQKLGAQAGLEDVAKEVLDKVAAEKDIIDALLPDKIRDGIKSIIRDRIAMLRRA